LAVVLGIGTGFALRPRSASAASSPDAAPSQAAGATGSSTDSEKQPRGATKLRSRTAEEGLTFSRKQWRELQRGSANLQIDLTDCLLWQRSVETPVENEPGWGSDGYSTSKIDGGPDLGPISAFLGLDEAKTERLRETLRHFGEQLREIERENAQLEYRGDGTARIDFGNAATSRRAAFDQLEGELAGALGSRDASRFLAATRLLPDEATADAIELKVSMTGNYLRMAIPGSFEAIITRDSGSIPKDMFMRVQHLGLDVDWRRLVEEAEAKASKR
jgi:hypothetical protein